MGLVLATSPCNKSQGLVTSCELATSPTNSNQFEFVGLRLDFVAKLASSHDATSPCDLLQGIVAGTSRIVCADLKATTAQASSAHI